VSLSEVANIELRCGGTIDTSNSLEKRLLKSHTRLSLPARTKRGNTATDMVTATHDSLLYYRFYALSILFMVAALYFNKSVVSEYAFFTGMG
jgi:hypothetical protein